MLQGILKTEQHGFNSPWVYIFFLGVRVMSERVVGERIFDVEIRIDSDGMLEIEEEHEGSVMAYLAEMIDEDDFSREVRSVGAKSEKDGYVFVTAVVAFIAYEEDVSDLHETLDDCLSADSKVIGIKEQA